MTEIKMINSIKAKRSHHRITKKRAAQLIFSSILTVHLQRLTTFNGFVEQHQADGFNFERWEKEF
jgi:hypothetical protein